MSLEATLGPNRTPQESSWESWTSLHLKLGAYVNVLLALCLEKPKDMQEVKTACLFRDQTEDDRENSGKEA